MEGERTFIEAEADLSVNFRRLKRLRDRIRDAVRDLRDSVRDAITRDRSPEEPEEEVGMVEGIGTLWSKWSRCS